MRTRSMLLILLALLFLLGTACGDAGPVSADPAPAASPDVVDIVSDTVVTMPTQQPSSVPTQAPTPEPIMVAGAAVQNGTLCAVVKADDFASIEQIEGLVTLDVSGSDCYDAILRYRDAHPEVKVLYTVPIGGVSIPSEAQSASVPRVPDPSLLHYLPNLTALSVTEPMAPDTAKALLSALPDATLDYAVSFAGMTVSSSETALDLSGVSPEKAAALAEGIAALPNLVDINLNRKNGSSAWKLKDAGVLQAVRPSLRVDLNITAFGVSFSLTDDVVSFSGIPMNKKKE